MPVAPNKFVRELDPYHITAQDVWGLTKREGVHKMDWNEGRRPFDFVRREAKRLLDNFEYYSWYPDCNAVAITDAIAGLFDVSPMNILVFPGSDVALETVCRTYLSEGDAVFLVSPTYDNVRVYVRSMGAGVIDYELQKPFVFELESFLEFVAVSRITPKAIYIVNPNNPCGYHVSLNSIRQICKVFPDALVVVDEAYIEFSGRTSAITLVDSYDNLVVARSFSKAMCLAGMRLGFLVANHGILRSVAHLRNGKNVSALAQALGVAIVRNYSKVMLEVGRVVRAREWLTNEMTKEGLVHYPSCTNFVLFEVPDPKYVCAELKSYGIYIRDRSAAISGAARVTVTDQESVEYFWKSLLQILKE